MTENVTETAVAAEDPPKAEEAVAEPEPERKPLGLAEVAYRLEKEAERIRIVISASKGGSASSRYRDAEALEAAARLIDRISFHWPDVKAIVFGGNTSNSRGRR